MQENISTTQTNAPGGETSWISLDDVIPFIYLTFGALGLIGNGLVLVVMIRVRSLRTITNLFITNQSVIDFLSSVFLLAIIYNPRKIDFSSLPVNIWSRILCYFWHSQYPFWTLLMCSTLNLIIVTLERYIAVVFPLVYRNRVTWKTASVFVILPWVLGSIFQLYWPAAHHLVDGVCYPSYGNRTNQMLLGMLIFVVKLLVPVVVMSVVYSSILMKLRPKAKVNPENHAQETHDGPNIAGSQVRRARPVEGRVANSTSNDVSANIPAAQDRIPGHETSDVPTRNTPATNDNPVATAANITTPHADRHSAHDDDSPPRNNETLAATMVKGRKDQFSNRIRTNVIKTLLIVTVVYALCWTPIEVLFLLYNIGILDTQGVPYTSGTPFKLFVVIVFINIWINPVIYTFKYRRFQEGLRKTFGIRQPQNVSSMTHTTTSRPH